MPDLKKLALRGYYKRFGTPGLVALVAATVIGSVWWSWESLSKLPGIRPLVTLVQREPIPQADPARFSVVVADFEQDKDDAIKNDVIQALNEYGAVQVLSLDRSISATGAYPQLAEKKGHDQAREYLHKSGANVLIWGLVLKVSAKKVPKLYWTVSTDIVLPTGNRRYPITSSDLSLPEVFTADLGEVLKLLVVQQSSELSSQEGRYVADRILPFLVRAEAIFGKLPAGSNNDARSSFLSILGDASFNYGSQSGDNKRLEKAIEYFREALAASTPDSHHWAAMQSDVGQALETLGARENGTARLEEAAAAQRAALDEYAREQDPTDRAATQNNLGNVLKLLGERESGTARLEEAVAAYSSALQERTRERDPLGWAITQNNLGSTLRTLGGRESGTSRLEQSVAAYRAALQEFTRERVPLDWATAQNNLGDVLETLGEREDGTARLEEAVAACRAALQERTRERVPLDWAMTQNNLANALEALGERGSGTAQVEEAVAAYTSALQEFTRERDPLDWATAKNNLAISLKVLGERGGGIPRLEESAAACRAALQERTRERVPLEWAETRYNLGAALDLIAVKQHSVKIFCESTECFLDSASVLYPAGDPIGKYAVQAAKDSLGELQGLWSKEEKESWMRDHQAELKAVLGESP